MDQISFGDAEYAAKKKTTRREVFLAEMDKVVPWDSLLKVIAPFYPVAGRGRRPYPVQTMLRVQLMQNWFGLSDPAMEEALYEISSMRRFARLNLQAIPDETTILNFRRMIETNELAPMIFDRVNALLERAATAQEAGKLAVARDGLGEGDARCPGVERASYRPRQPGAGHGDERTGSEAAPRPRRRLATQGKAQRQGLVDDRAEQAAQEVVLLLPVAHALEVDRPDRQEHLDLGTTRWREVPVDIGVQIGLGDGRADGGFVGGRKRCVVHRHFTRCIFAAAGSPPSRPWSSTRSRSRARDSRDITVPTGTSSARAISR